MDNMMENSTLTTSATVTRSQETYKDNYSATITKDRDKYLDALRAFGAYRTPVTVSVRDLHFMPMPDALDVSNFCNYDAARHAIVDDCITNGTKVYMEYDGEQYMLRDTALASIYERLKIGGQALSKLDGDTLARHLNDYVKVGEGEGLMLFNNCKVEGILGKNYRLIPAENVMDAAAEFFEKEKSRFLGGYICHQSTSSEWNMGVRRIQIPLQTGMEERIFVQSVTIKTSDCGFSSITIAPTMQEMEDLYGLKYSLPLSADHTGDTDLEKFKSNLDQITAQFDAATTNIKRLASIQLNYPINTLMYMFRWLKVPLKYGTQISETRKPVWKGQRKTAFDVYSTLSDVLALSLGDEYSVRKTAELQEKFARALQFPFANYDLPGDLVYAQLARGVKAA